MLQQPGGVGTDHPLRKRRRLGQQEPRPVAQRRAGAHALELVDGGDDVDQRHAGHAVGMIEGEAVGDPGTAVVTDDREALVT